jgi:hypothetical protein
LAALIFSLIDQAVSDQQSAFSLPIAQLREHALTANLSI